MDNFGTVTKAVTMQLGAQGSAMREHEKHIDSIAGRMEQLKATIESVFNEAISSDMIKSLVSGLEALISGFGSFNKILLYTATILGVAFGGKVIKSLQLFSVWIKVSILDLLDFGKKIINLHQVF